MRCIFCGNERNPTEEHVIPENIGGVLKVYNICKKCNNFFGTSVDAVLNRHRHIYDAFRKLPHDTRPELEFNFIDSYHEFQDGSKVPASRVNTSLNFYPAKMADGGVRFDSNDPSSVINSIKRLAKKHNIGPKTVNRKINDFLFWFNKKEIGSTYIDNIFNIRIIHEAGPSHRVTLMNANTPHQFLAKALVELAYILEIHDSILEIDLFREHAQKGNQLEVLHFHEEHNESQPIPYHLVGFSETQFHVHFFNKYLTSVELHWRFEPKTIYFVNDISSGFFRICKQIDNELEFTNNALHPPKPKQLESK